MGPGQVLYLNITNRWVGRNKDEDWVVGIYVRHEEPPKQGTTQMTRFADTHTRLVDQARTTQIAQFEAKRTEREFAPIKAKAARNIKAMSAKRTWALY